MSVVNITDNYRKKPNPKRSEVRTVPNVLEKLDDLGIKYEKVEHEAVYTCEQTEFVKGLKSENVFCGNGSDDVLATAFRAFFNSDKPSQIFSIL